MSLTAQQALDCFASHDLIGLGMEADALRRSLHPQNTVTYVLEATLYPHPTAAEDPALLQQARTARQAGATSFVLAETPNPAAALKALGPATLLSAASIAFPIEDTLRRLRDLGLQSLGAAAMDIGTTDWLPVHRTAHALGIPTAASMVFGRGESLEARIAHLQALYQLQQETGGFTAFTPAAYQSERPLDDATSVEYLKTLAICRLFLDNIPNIEASWRTQGTKVLQMALRFGANDAGPADLAQRPTSGATEEDLRRIIRDANARPVQRNTPYTLCFLD